MSPVKVVFSFWLHMTFCFPLLRTRYFLSFQHQAKCLYKKGQKWGFWPLFGQWKRVYICLFSFETLSNVLIPCAKYVEQKNYWIHSKVRLILSCCWIHSKVRLILSCCCVPCFCFDSNPACASLNNSTKPFLLFFLTIIVI